MTEKTEGSEYAHRLGSAASVKSSRVQSGLLQISRICFFKVRASNMVRAGESLLKLTSDLKQYLILNDFPRNIFVVLSFSIAKFFSMFVIVPFFSFGIRSHFCLYFSSHFKSFFYQFSSFWFLVSLLSFYPYLFLRSPVSVLIL